MQFVPPSTERYRISDCGRYLIEKIHVGAEAVYCIWEYTTQRGGFKSMDDAREELMRREFERYEAAAEVGTVRRCPECGKEDGARGRVREMLEGDL